MSYQVLARKWRPATFDELVGQEHVVKALVNALDSGRLHHAYLFTGTRGVGKTTIARILARSLNCERGVGPTPCGECGACASILEGRFVDLIEVDAASRTKVEDTRELLENVQYTPTSGRYKIYLIDEVHMLSRHSFNALLKTLEEPPPHVKFLLATTDPQKLPVTVLSRCLQFNLKRVSGDEIQALMQRIVEAEGVASEPAALDQLALAADGSVRDGLSLLDQAISFAADNLTADDIRLMLGSIAGEHLLDVMAAVADRDAESVLQRVEALAESAPDFAMVLDELLSLHHGMAVSQALADEAKTGQADERLRQLASRFAADELQMNYEFLLRARRDLSYSPVPRHALEMALLRMLSFAPDSGQPVKSTPTRTSGSTDTAPHDAAHVADVSTSGSVEQAAVEPARTPPAEGSVSPVESAAPTAVRTLAAIAEDWAGAVGALGISGMPRALADHCSVEQFIDGAITLRIAESDTAFLTDKSQATLTEALTVLCGSPLRVNFTRCEAVEDSPAALARKVSARKAHDANVSIHADPVVQTLTNEFEASIIPGSIEPASEHNGDNR